MLMSNLSIVILPGASFQPVHYGFLSNLFLEAGYSTVTALLPSTGALNGAAVTIEDDVRYVRDRMILPLLENEQQDVVIFGHSYGGLTGSPAVVGLDKVSRAAAGKKTAVLGQIYVSAAVARGGDNSTLLPFFGGKLPPHLEKPENLIRFTSAIRQVFFHDVKDDTLAEAAFRSTLAMSYTVYESPIPRASFDDPGYDGRIAYIKTTDDYSISAEGQQAIVDATGANWTVREIPTGHAPFLSRPVELAEIIFALVKPWEEECYGS